MTWWQSCKLGTRFHAMQLSTTFIPSRNFVYLLQCSAVDIQTHSFTIQTVPASLPAVGQYYPMLAHLWLFFIGNERVNFLWRVIHNTILPLRLQKMILANCKKRYPFSFINSLKLKTLIGNNHLSNAGVSLNLCHFMGELKWSGNWIIGIIAIPM